MGSPRAFRAVGQALNKNPDPKTVPCHRVIKFNGHVGEYKLGTKRKIALLRKEEVVIKNRRVVLYNPHKLKGGNRDG